MDDGYSGTNFNRPDFKRMMERVEAGLIKRVIVKDMSRFGRNYLEVGYYTEVIFPEYDVQFIAVNDNVDSEVQTDNDFTPFRNIMNEWYAKDISKKMKSAIKAKGNSGKHTNPLPPYGYIKDPNDKNKWLIDEEAATVVRRIFGLCMQGFGPTQISRILTDEGVDTPKIHAKKMGRKVTIRANEMPEAWADQTVGAILGYWEYLGWTVNFKTKKNRLSRKKLSCYLPMNGKYSKIHKSRSSTKKRFGRCRKSEKENAALTVLANRTHCRECCFAEIADIGYIYADNVIRTKKIILCVRFIERSASISARHTS